MDQRPKGKGHHQCEAQHCPLSQQLETIFQRPILLGHEHIQLNLLVVF